MDSKSLALSDLQRTRIFSCPTNLRSTPRSVGISNEKISYQVAVIMEEDWVEELSSHSN